MPEALLHALETGNNQIFLSASRAQAHQFKGFIIALARLVGVELKGGDKIILSTGTTFYFLGTAAASAQSYTGDLYFDEFFWVANFAELRKVAAAMASQVGLRRTYFSTPSSEEHEAYPFWTGDFFNESRLNPKISIDTTHKTLKNGVLCGDNIWRQIVTIHDAINSGFDLISLADIESENTRTISKTSITVSLLKPVNGHSTITPLFTVVLMVITVMSGRTGSLTPTGRSVINRCASVPTRPAPAAMVTASALLFLPRLPFPAEMACCRGASLPWHGF